MTSGYGPGMGGRQPKASGSAPNYKSKTSSSKRPNILKRLAAKIRRRSND